MNRLLYSICIIAGVLIGDPVLALSIQLAPGGEPKALVVGANKYRGKDIAQLRGAEADALDLSKSLSAAGFKVTKLINEDLTRESLVRAMTKLISEAKSNDLIVITFAGHGARVPEYSFWKGLDEGGLNEEYILPGFEKHDDGTKEVVVDKEIKAWISRLHAKGAEVIFLADTCHGGGLSRAFLVGSSGEQSVRYTRDAFVAATDNRFRPIDVKPEEARADISKLDRVTFLAGVDESHVVYEVSVPGEPTLRGALSYAFARLLQGKGVPADGAVTRRTLYRLRQLVRQYSDNRQDPSFLPQSLDGDPKIYDRPLFRITGASHAQAPTPLPAVKLALVNGDVSMFERIGKPAAPLELAATPQSADLVWDIGGKKVLGRHDLILSAVEPSIMPGVIDRTSAVAALAKISEARLLDVALKEGGRLYSSSAGDHPTLVVEGLVGGHLLVFNLAADGRIQMLRPRERRYQSIVDGELFANLRFDIAAPYGADTVVAVVADNPPAELETWLWSVNGLVGAGELSKKLSEAIARDPTMKIGYTGLYTGP